jgi:hypothetical protein
MIFLSLLLVALVMLIIATYLLIVVFFLLDAFSLSVPSILYFLAHNRRRSLSFLHSFFFWRRVARREQAASIPIIAAAAAVIVVLMHDSLPNLSFQLCVCRIRKMCHHHQRATAPFTHSATPESTKGHTHTILTLPHNKPTTTIMSFSYSSSL